MTTYRQGEVVLVAFPFSSSAQAKRRPALVVLASGDAYLLLARITTRQHRTEHDVVIAGWREAGLAAPSVVRLHKLGTIERGLVERRLGQLPPADLRQVALVMRQTFGSW